MGITKEPLFLFHDSHSGCRRKATSPRAKIIRHLDYLQTLTFSYLTVLPQLTTELLLLFPQWCALRRNSQMRGTCATLSINDLPIPSRELSLRTDWRLPSLGHRVPLLIIHFPREALTVCVEIQKDSDASSTTV